MKNLKTASDVVDALGGPTAAGRLCGVTTQAAWNWTATGKLPAVTYLIIRRELLKQKASAPIDLWGMIDPDQRRAS